MEGKMKREKGKRSAMSDCSKKVISLQLGFSKVLDRQSYMEPVQRGSRKKTLFCCYSHGFACHSCEKKKKSEQTNRAVLILGGNTEGVEGEVKTNVNWVTEE